ncbi:protein yellow-like [Frankliniella occidentalis]|uniref:Protein yellow-like n=1 Tax=Frankliniella occidentalis TaxID=133901 RepID=A0A6J1TMQ6_FRAOC|nr:protein yellow-like [Frankliniella occidentalis]
MSIRGALLLALGLAVIVAHASAHSCNCARCAGVAGNAPITPAYSADSSEQQTSTAVSTRSSAAVQWIGGSFVWPCVSTKNIYKQSKRYVPKSVIATRMQIYGTEAFVALPRFKAGVPATLVKVDLKHRGCQAELTPFPCWSVQEEGNCEALQSVVDIFLDANNILWALDAGIVNTLEQPVRRCSPKVMAFDVKTGKLIKKVDLSSLTCPASRLQYLVVDYAKDGRIFLYISDAATRSIIVYDVTSGKGYRLVLPKAVTLGCGKTDVLYLALARSECGNNVLFFTYLSSQRLFSIKTAYLQSGSTAGRVHDHGPKNGKIVILGTDGGQFLFFRFEGSSEILRWNTNTCFKSDNFEVVYNSPDCLLATQVAPDYKIQRIRILESNFPDFILGQVGCGAYQVINVIDNQCQ